MERVRQEAAQTCRVDDREQRDVGANTQRQRKRAASDVRFNFGGEVG